MPGAGAGSGPKQLLGARGEAAVAASYEALGFSVLDRNWRDGPRGEIDLVLGKGQVVVVCEVKTRTGGAFGGGAEAVGRAKQARLRRLAMAWVLAHRDDVGWVDIRIDVAVVNWPARAVAPSIEIIESAC